MDKDTIHLCVVPYPMFFRVIYTLLGNSVVYCHIVLLVNYTSSDYCLYIIFLFIKMQYQTQENIVDTARDEYLVIFILVFQPG